MKYSNRNFLKTGIPGLDDILAGGLPADRMYLVEGNPGGGKTTLAMQFLLEGLKAGERCLYITLSESIQELTAVAESHGWRIGNLHLFELPIEEQLTADDQNTFFHTSEIELGATNQALIREINRVQPTRVVIDSLTELKLMSQNANKFRRQILAFKRFFMEKKITVLLLDDKTSSIADREVHSMVHGLLNLEQLAPEFGPERRRLMVSKLRGVSFRGGYHDFLIRKGGLVVFPRLIASEHKATPLQEQIGSGVPRIDLLMGGGVERGSSTLIMGPAGSGKSTLAVQYAVSAASRGEKSAIFTFDESVQMLSARCEGMAIPLRKYLDNGLILIKQVDPAQLSPGEFSAIVRAAVDEFKARVVLIDSLNGYLSSMPEERFLIIQMHELLSYLSQMGVATFLVVVQHGILGSSMGTSVDISYLADNVFLLRYFEDAGSVKQILSVVKRRAGRHERTIRELSFTSNGIQVGEPLKNFRGILSGSPEWIGNQHE